MNLIEKPHRDDAFEQDFDAQASAFLSLGKSIEDTMEEIPDRIRVWQNPQDELALAGEGLNF
jgi:hypothetical protein